MMIAPLVVWDRKTSLAYMQTACIFSPYRDRNHPEHGIVLIDSRLEHCVDIGIFWELTGWQ